MRIADRRNVLPALNGLAAMNEDFIEMTVKRIDVAHASAFAVGVADDDHVSPALVTISRKNNNAIADAIHRIAQIGIAAANSVPIFAEMSVRSHSASFVISAAVRLTDRQIETVRQFGERRLGGETDR